MNTFTINNKTYSIRLSNHAQERLHQRNIDLYQATGLILLLGEQRINQYAEAKADRDILIQDKENNFSVVCSINYCTITIITVIDHIDCFVKSGTTIINM